MAQRSVSRRNSERTMVAARAELRAKSSGFLPPSEVESPFPAEQTMDSLHNSVSIFEMVVLLSEDWDASSLAESGVTVTQQRDHQLLIVKF